jgi:hypothetical protein
MATIKKAQNGAKTKDSTAYFSNVKNNAYKVADEYRNAAFSGGDVREKAKKVAFKASDDLIRQSKKGKPGKDANGYPVKKKMKNGGSLTGLKASNKRVGPVDPKGAFTKVQKKTLAGAKGKASLTKDKQLGATKMAKCGAKMSKK